MTRLSPQTVDAIVRRLRQIPRPSRVAQGPGRRQPPDGFWAELTGESSEGGAYSWKALQPDGEGGLKNHVSGVTGTENAFEVSGAKGITVGTRVFLRFAGLNAEGEPVFLFVQASASVGFAAKITANIGSGAYTFVEQEIASGGSSYQNKAGGRIGTARHRNGSTAVATGTIVWMTLETDADGNAQYRFDSISLPAGTGQYKVLQLDENNNPIWDWVRAS